MKFNLVLKFLFLLSLINMVLLRKNKKSKKSGEGNNCLADWEVINPFYKTQIDSSFDEEKIKTIKNRLRFTHGQCSPILIVPGLMATRLNAIINCDAARKNVEFWRRFEIFCGKKVVCKDNSKLTEMYSFWPNANHYGFNMQTNESNTCFAFFLNIYNNEQSCFNSLDPDSNNTKCMDLDSFIKIYPAFINKKPVTKDKDKFQCGLGPIKNILTEYWSGDRANYFAGAARGFEDIYQFLIKKGYEEGFSLGAVPYDFRQNYCLNDDFATSFEKMVTYLFEQTGKKVTIVAHSYGNLNSLYQMTKGSLKDKTKDLINHFISIAPPLTGVIKTALMASRGSPELTFNENYYPVKFNRFAQVLALPTSGSTYGLFKYNAFETILKHNPQNEKMVEFVDKMKAFMKLSNCIHNTKNLLYCRESINPSITLDFMTELFGNDANFIEDNAVCSQHSALNTYIKEIYPESLRKEISEVPLSNVCWYKIFDFVNCSSVVNEPEEYKDYGIDLKDHYLKHYFCNLYPKDLKYYNIIKDDKEKQEEAIGKKVDASILKEFFERKENNAYFNTSETGKKNIVDFLKEKTVLPNLFAEFHDILGTHIKNIDVNDKDLPFQIQESINSANLFSREKVAERIQNNSLNCKNINQTIEDLPHPGVRITGIFNRSIETKVAFLAKSEYDNREQTRQRVLYSGGDGTVDTESSLTPFFKWAFESKYDKKPQVDLFDYCPGINKTGTGSKYYYTTYDKITNGKNNYKLLKCKCVDENGKFLKEVTSCAHAGMLDDPSISQLIYDVTSNYVFDTPMDTFENIYKRILKNFDTLTLCFDIFNEIYFPKPNLDFTPEKIYNYVHDTGKKLKRRKRSKRF